MTDRGVLHQDSVYPAAVEAVPFVAHAAVHATHGRADMLAFLAGAGGSGGPEPSGGFEEDGRTRVADEAPTRLREDARQMLARSDRRTTVFAGRTGGHTARRE
ncbi:hypothetical protein GCM10025734_80690 [Kitasatospora paranensis]|uniref:hypothetical protein n=1 Tax=Kitasatospora paranensis TaxID=258053 RepID=UPI0031E6DC91